jgi:hypothetical protein
MVKYLQQIISVKKLSKKTLLLYSLIIFIVGVFYACKNNEAYMIVYNSFDTFTLTPKMSNNKTSLEIECNYIDNKISNITFMQGDKVILKDTVYYVGEKKYLVHDFINKYIKDEKLNKEKIIRYTSAGDIVELRLRLQNNKFNLYKVNKIKPNNTYNFYGFNVEEFENVYFDSVEEFLNDKIHKLIIYDNAESGQLVEFHYVENEVRLLDVYNRYGFVTRGAGTVNYISYGGCLYLDTLHYYYGK